VIEVEFSTLVEVGIGDAFINQDASISKRRVLN
jgi:hypothetical protein